MNKFAKQLLDSEKRIAIPIMTHPGIEAIGKRVIDAVTDGDVHYQAIRNVTETYDTAACTVIMDLTVEAEAFGCTISMPEHEVPSVTGRLVYDAETVDKLQIPSLSAGRVPEYLKANRLAIENIHDKPVLSGCIGPFSLAGRLYDMSEIMVGIYIEPEVIQALLEKCATFILHYCQELKRLGVTGVIMAEPAAGLLSDEDCMNYSTVYVKRIVEAVQDDDFIVILLKQASAKEVYRQTMDLLEKTADYRNFVLSSGCDMPPLVPDANIRAFYQAVADFNAKK